MPGGTVNSKGKWLILAGVFAFFTITIWTSYRFGGDQDTLKSAPTYRVVREWSIPNGGYGRVVVMPSAPTETEIRAFGERIRHDTKTDRNAFVFVYDEEKAATLRDTALSGTLSPIDRKYHDRHSVANYIRNGNTGVENLRISVEGLDGNRVVVTY